MYRVIQVLPPERKHPLDLNYSKSSGTIVYRCRTFCKNLIFFNETSKHFVFEINGIRHLSAKFSYDLLLNWAVTSTKEVDMGYLWHPLGTKKLLEKFSTDVNQQ
jgi:hypothetical protein